MNLVFNPFIAIILVQITELEAKVELYESERSRGTGKSSTSSNEGTFLPKPPVQYHLKGHRDSVTSVSFHPEYDFVCSTSEDATIRVWDFDQGRIEKQFKGHTDSVRHCNFHPKGHLLASCSNDLTIKLWDFETGQCVKTLHGHDHTVSCVKFIAGGDFIASASRDNTIKIWETSTGYCKHTLYGHDEWIRKLDVSIDGQWLVSGGSDHTVRVWSLKDNKCVLVFHEHENVVESVAFAPPASAAMINKGLRLKEARSQGPQTPVKGSYSIEKEEGETKEVQYVAACGRDKAIYIFDIETGNVAMKLVGHDNWVRDIKFLADGTHLVSVSDDRTMRVWDIKEQRCVKTIQDAHGQFVQCIDYCERNPRIATGGADNTVNIWACR